jgi:hypothetical protein
VIPTHRRLTAEKVERDYRSQIEGEPPPSSAGPQTQIDAQRHYCSKKADDLKL